MCSLYFCLISCFFFLINPVCATCLLRFCSVHIVNPKNLDFRFLRFTICDFSGESSSLKRAFKYNLTAWNDFSAVFQSLHMILKSSAYRIKYPSLRLEFLFNPRYVLVFLEYLGAVSNSALWAASECSRSCKA